MYYILPNSIPVFIALVIDDLAFLMQYNLHTLSCSIVSIDVLRLCFVVH